MPLNIPLPTLEELSDKNSPEALRRFLVNLYDQLNHSLLNIEEKNLSEDLSKTITSAYNSSEESKKNVVEFGKAVSSFSQSADKINWFIKSGASSTDFSLTGNAVSLITSAIDVKGYVTFSDLEATGKTSINGSNIITGSITADKLSVSDLSSLSATIGGWSISSERISSIDTQRGSFYLNSASSDDNYWIKAQNAYGYTTFYIAKNGSCYFDGNYISDGTISASKIITDTNQRLDLSNNNYGIKVGQDICLSHNNSTCRMFINTRGILSFETGSGNSAFSFALNRTDSTYSLSVLNGTGNVVGTIPLENTNN